MNLFITRIFQNNSAQPSSNQQKRYGFMPNFKGLREDTFVKSASPSFKGNGSKTKAGDCLKELDNITCPYSGVKMLSSAKMDKIERRLAHCKNISDGVAVVEQHKPCMQKLEKQMFGIFKTYSETYPNKTVNSCLQELKPQCLAKLRIEEFKVLDNIDKISNKIEPTKALEIRRLTTNARKQILEDKDDHIFKRKDILYDLENIMENYKDKTVAQEMREVANKLPNSRTNINAFVVKYANRSQQEVLARLLRPSVASIEHITPKSIKPDNTLSNFMLASRDWNSDRGNMPLPDYIKKHPSIPKNCQRYTDDIIKAIHKSKLQDCDWYPYMLKEKLFNESNGIIDIKLKKYNISENDAFKNASPELVEKYNSLKELNKPIPPHEA